MLDCGHGGPSSSKAPVPYPWHRSLIKWPGQKKAHVFNGDLCGQMMEEWRSPVLCSIWNPGEFRHTWGRITRMTEGEKKKERGWIFYWPWCVRKSGENEIQSFLHTWFWGWRSVYTILVTWVHWNQEYGAHLILIRYNSNMTGQDILLRKMFHTLPVSLSLWLFCMTSFQ